MAASASMPETRCGGDFRAIPTQVSACQVRLEGWPNLKFSKRGGGGAPSDIALAHVLPHLLAACIRRGKREARHQTASLCSGAGFFA